MNKIDTIGDLWIEEMKLRGLAGILSMAGGDPPMCEDAYKGISRLLFDIADKLSRLKANLELTHGRSRSGFLTLSKERKSP